jgi:hypothetical protein
MSEMLTVLKAVAPNSATVAAAGDGIEVIDRWPGRDERCTLQFSPRPGGTWAVIVVTEGGIGAAPRRLRPFRPAGIERLTRFLADPLRRFLKPRRS